MQGAFGFAESPLPRDPALRGITVDLSDRQSQGSQHRTQGGDIHRPHV